MDENLDENAIHEIEDELDTKIYPGTEIMRDVGSHHFVRAGDTVGEGQVLVPQPSNDPHDPLNWNAMWKMITITCASVLSFTLNFGPLANAPLFGLSPGHSTGFSRADVGRALHAGMGLQLG